MFKKLSIFLLVLLFSSNAFAFCLFGLGDCGGKNFFLIDKNQTILDINSDVSGIFGGVFIDVNSNVGDVLVSLNLGDLNNVYDGRYESLGSIVLWDTDFNSNWNNRINFYDLNNSLDYLSSGTYIPTESSIDANINEIIASRMPITDNNLDIPNVWAAIDGNASGGGIGTFKGLTSTAMDGNMSFDGNTGYVAANGMCDGNHTGTHWCTTDEILASINDNNYMNFPNGDTAWIAEGPPGFLSSSNDCVGMTANTSTYLGAFWLFNTTRGGEGWLTNCANKKTLACCK